jgi:hypothetical protein
MKIFQVWSLAIAVSGGVAQGQTQAAKSEFKSLDGAERLKYFSLATFGPAAMGTGLIGAGFGTWRNLPEEWGTHWDGFGMRYGSGLGRRVVSKGVDTALGAIWGEDPRYRRLGEGSMKVRIGNVAKMVVLSYNESGHTMPAYSRYAGIATSSLVAQAWLPDSRRSADATLQRIGMGFVDRAVGNAMREFLPDLKRKLRKPKSSDELLIEPVR